MSASRRRGSPGASPARAPERGQRAGVGVDQPRTDRRSGIEAHGGGGFGRQPALSGVPGSTISAPRREKPVGRQPAEADAVQELARPAPLMPEIAELAGDRAERARERAGRAERQPVGEAEKMRRLGEGLGLRPAEPGELRRLHFRRQGAPDVAQNPVAAGVDAVCVLGRAMVHPRHHVAFGRVGRADREGVQAGVERDQRAGGGEADAREGLTRKAASLDRLTHGFGRGGPDVGRRLLDRVAGLAPERDRTPGAGEQPPAQIERAGPGAARADVHANECIRHCA